MERNVYDIDPITMDYLQSLYYEYNSYKDILQDILLIKRKYKHNEETYQHFIQEYKEAYTKYELLKEEIIRTYVEDYSSTKSCNYSFDFYNRTLTIL